MQLQWKQSQHCWRVPLGLCNILLTAFIFYHFEWIFLYFRSQSVFVPFSFFCLLSFNPASLRHCHEFCAEISVLLLHFCCIATLNDHLPTGCRGARISLLPFRFPNWNCRLLSANYTPTVHACSPWKVGTHSTAVASKYAKYTYLWVSSCFFQAHDILPNHDSRAQRPAVLLQNYCPLPSPTLHVRFCMLASLRLLSPRLFAVRPLFGPWRPINGAKFGSAKRGVSASLLFSVPFKRSWDRISPK